MGIPIFFEVVKLGYFYLEFHAWSKLMSKRGSLMTLLKYFALSMLPPVTARNRDRSEAKLESVRSCNGPLTEGFSLSCSEAMWHHKQQCLPINNNNGDHGIFIR